MVLANCFPFRQYILVVPLGAAFAHRRRMSFSTGWLQVESALSGVPLLGLRSSSSSGAESGPSLAALGLYSAVFTSSSGALRSIQSPDTK